MVNYSAKSGGLVKRLRHSYISDIDACCCRRKRQRMDTLKSNQNQYFVNYGMLWNRTGEAHIQYIFKIEDDIIILKNDVSSENY